MLNKRNESSKTLKSTKGSIVESTRELLVKLGSARIAAMGVISLLLIGFFAFIIMRVTTPQMAPIYTDLSFEDSSAIVSRLESMDIPFEITGRGATILAPADKILRLRMQLAEDGLPTGGNIGYEIFDKSDTLGATSFVQNINRLRALEGELARTIRTITRIKTARVHLVIPERQLFQRDAKEPTASIAVKVTGSLDASQIRAIQHLVASAVEGLKPSRVSIIDESGQLLASGSENDPSIALASTLDKRKTAIENRLRGRIEDILSKIVGPGRARVQVSASLDHNRISQTSERYDPDGQVVRSTQTKEQNSSRRQPTTNGGVTVGNELPGTNGTGSGASEDENRNSAEEVINYEIAKTVKTEVIEAGQLKRISVAVLVDGIYTKNNNGEVQYAPRSNEQLDRIAALVRSAVGYDQERGDTIEVVNLPFAEQPTEPISAETSWLELTKQDYFKLAELGVIALLTLFVLLFVIRPLLKQVLKSDESMITATTKAKALTDNTTNNNQDASLPTQQNMAIQNAAQNSILKNIGNSDTAALSPENEMLRAIEAAQNAGEAQNTSIKHIGEMVDKNPDETLKIIRGWLNEAA